MSKTKIIISLSVLILFGILLKTNYSTSTFYLGQMEKCFLDGQIPCRWSADANQNYGYPYFQFNSPFLFYLAMIFRLFGFDYGLSIFSANILALIIGLFVLFKISKSSKPKNIAFTLITSIFMLSFYLGPLIFEKQYLLSSLNYSYPSITLPTVISGDALITEYRKRSEFWRFTIDVNQGVTAKILVPVVYFPGWTILSDSQKITPSSPIPLQLTQIEIPPGKHTIIAFYQNSSVRNIFDLISLAALLFTLFSVFPKNVPKKDS